MRNWSESIEARGLEKDIIKERIVAIELIRSSISQGKKPLSSLEKTIFPEKVRKIM